MPRDPTPKAEPANPKPESLEAKFLLLQKLPYDERVKRKHMLVYGFILDWYHAKYGNALASVRHVVDTIKSRDVAAKGLSLPHVHSALSDLTAWGYLSQEKGAGRRASRYVPNWSLLCRSVHTVGNTNDNGISVTPVGNAGVHTGGNATASIVTPVGNEDPSTRTRSLDPGTEIDGYDCSTPLAVGLTATARAAQGGFEELWQTYAYRRGKRAAKAAYDKLAPDEATHSAIIASATAWQAAWAAQGRSDAPRRHLHIWLRDEDWDCDPPTAYTPKERRAVPAVTPERTGKPDVADTAPRGKFTVEIVDVERLGGMFDPEVPVRIGLASDQFHGVLTHEFLAYSSVDKVAAERGRQFMNDIEIAVGKFSLDDADDMLFQPLIATINKDGMITYSPAPAGAVAVRAAA